MLRRKTVKNLNSSFHNVTIIIMLPSALESYSKLCDRLNFTPTAVTITIYRLAYTIVYYSIVNLFYTE
jgi:hypothetical protein